MTDNEELENRNDALIEEYLLFLRGRGPEPDLSDLPPSRREEIRGQFKIEGAGRPRTRTAAARAGSRRAPPGPGGPGRLVFRADPARSAAPGPRVR